MLCEHKGNKKGLGKRIAQFPPTVVSLLVVDVPYVKGSERPPTSRVILCQ